MLGMSFGEFIVLAVISLFSALVMHYGFNYRVLKGVDGFFAKWIVGWVGAWLGSPVLGHWWGAIGYQHIYIVPALIGAFVGSFMSTAVWKAQLATTPRHEATQPGELHRAA